MHFYFRSPSHTTEINWVHKIGYYLLSKEKEKADDWIIILDHSVQIGNEKIFVVYGIQNKNIDFSRALKLEDLTPLIIEVKQKSNGEEVKKRILKLKEELGNILYAVGDHGSDIKCGLELAEITHIHDITHKIALILGKIYESSGEYEDFTKQMSIMRVELSQSKLAFIIPPKQKKKSRYQNIDIIVKWGINALKYLEKSNIDNEIYNKLKWVDEYKAFILELSELNKIIKEIEKIIKNNGLDSSVINECMKILDKCKNGKMLILKKNLEEYFNEMRKHISTYKKILCTSDVIESAFGKYKNYVSNNPMAGVTNLVLSLSAFTSTLLDEEIKTALESTPINKIKEWTKKEIGDSVLKRRRLVFNYV